MQVLLINQFYVPDLAPTGRFLHDLGRVLADRGHGVRVLASRRGYAHGSVYPRTQVLDGVQVDRVHGGATARGHLRRLLAGAVFTSLLTARALRAAPQPDVIVSLTTPPYVGLAAAFIARRHRACLVHWVMDVYPDVMAAHGMLRRAGSVFRALQGLSRLSFKKADRIVVLGPYMLRAVLPYLSGPERADWIPLWGRPYEPAARPQADKLRRSRGWSASETVFLYSGNMGRGHRLNEFLEAARRLGPAGPLWAFAGGGARRAEVEALVETDTASRVQLLPYVGEEELSASLLSADVHLASLSSGWQGLIVPSKVQAAFSVGCPVLFVGPRDNEIADWIERSQGGWVVPEDDVEGVLAATERARDPRERRRRGRAALKFAHAHFDQETNCRRLADLLEETATAPRRRTRRS